MYKGVKFGVPTLDEIEEDLRELAATVPQARTIQLLSANPLALPYDKLAPILEKINEYLPDIEYVYGAGRVTDFRNKTVEQLRELKDLGLREITMGTESGDDWTLEEVLLFVENLVGAHTIDCILHATPAKICLMQRPRMFFRSPKMPSAPPIDHVGKPVA